MLQNISERYQIQQEIGAGGMGTVYLGLDKQSKQNVAIKALKKELTQPEMLERFKREGQALRELNHPNIVKLLDTLDVEGQYYLVMEYVAAGDLRQLLQNGKLPYQRCLNIAIDLADALTRAHRLNIIHRDLKPANVLVAEDGTIRLTDFGVAHVVHKERVTETDAIVGTLDYLPPEVLNGEAVEPRSDIWAFGVMLFEMLAGQRPFNGTGYLQILQAIATAPIPDLETLAPDAPTALVDLVYRMLNRDPQARISSVRYVGAELEEILQGGHNRPVTKRFDTPTPDVRLRPKHNLPALANPFVGREAELVEVARLLRNPKIRLVSIIAQGGMGKTRLSLASAAQHIDHFEHGVFFVELAPLGSIDGEILPLIHWLIQLLKEGKSLLQAFQSLAKNSPSSSVELIRSVAENLEAGIEPMKTMELFRKRANSHYVDDLVSVIQRHLQEGGNLASMLSELFQRLENQLGSIRWANSKAYVEDLVITAIANALGYQFQNDGREPKQQICDYLQAKEILLVLDNFEHLLDAAGIVTDLLNAAPKLKILVTSRQRLDQNGESLFHLSGMDFPAWETPDDAMNYGSMKLFMNSAIRAKPNFELTTDNLDAVARICKLVQGMPLGIVLAAAWLGMLSPEEIASELQKGLDFLESDSQQIRERQRSMRAIMEYSWQQMSEAEQVVFAKLSAFRGGFTREAAEGVAGANLRILLSLVNKSLLYRNSTTGRYEIHELLRQYAEEKSDVKANRDTHCRFFAGWMKAREADLKGNRDLEAVRAIRSDFENLKAAWGWAVEMKKFAEIDQSLWAFILYFRFAGSWQDCKSLFELALNLKDDEILHSKIFAANYVTNWSFQPQIEKMRESLKLSREKLNPIWQSFVAYNLAMALTTQANFTEAEALVDDALALIDASDEPFWYAQAAYGKYYVLGKKGIPETFTSAKSFITKAYDLYDSLGNKWGKSSTLYNMGVNHAFDLEFDLAMKAFREHLPIAQAYQNTQDLCHIYMNISVLYIEMGNYPEALKAGQARLEIAKEYEVHTDLFHAHAVMAEILSLTEQYEEAYAHIQAIADYSQRPELDPFWKRIYLAAIHFEKGSLDFRRKNYLEAIENMKRFMELNRNSDVLHFITLGLAEIRLGDFQNGRMHLLQALPSTMLKYPSLNALYGLAELEALNGDKSTAVEYSALVYEHRGTEYEFREYANELLAKLQSEMSAEEYQAAYERGKSLDLETLTRQVLADAQQE